MGVVFSILIISALAGIIVFETYSIIKTIKLKKSAKKDKDGEA